MAPLTRKKGQVPPVVQIGTEQIGTASLPTVPIYTDPMTGEVSVRGWMTSTITDTGTFYNGHNMNVFTARVTVNYVFRGRAYSVTMNTIRASDI